MGTKSHYFGEGEILDVNTKHAEERENAFEYSCKAREDDTFLPVARIWTHWGWCEANYYVLKFYSTKRKRKIKVLWEQVICSMNSYKSYARVAIHSLHSSDSSSETDEKALLQPMETRSCQGRQRN